MFEQRVSGRYARSLLIAAQAEALEDTIYKDLQYIDKVIDECKDLKAMTLSPVIQHWRKKNVYNEVFKGKINDLTMRFIMLLTEKKREMIIDSIIYQYESQYNILKNRQKVEIYSAVDLSDDLIKDVLKHLTDMTKKTILPNYTVESALMGGLMVRIGDWVYDASVKNQLENLHDRLAGIHGYEGN